jgi:hypothetical protein
VSARVAFVLILGFGSACAKGKAPQGEVPDSGAGLPDGGSVDRADAARTIDAGGGGGEVTLTQSSSMTIDEGNSLGCQDVDFGFTYSTSYYRVFDLPALGIDGPLDIEQVSVGIEYAMGGNGTDQPARVRLHTLDGAFKIADLTQIASVSLRVADAQALSVIDVPVTATVPAGSTLVVEFLVPDGSANLNTLFPGSNSANQTGPTYVRSSACSIPQPTDVATLDPPAPDMHLVMSVLAEQ